jgi:hypothetical protein
MMPFFNQPSLIVQEKMGNLHNFIYRDKKIIYQSFNKETGKIRKKVINHQATNDYDAGINPSGEIYLVCRNENNSVVLLSSHRDFAHSRVIVEAERKAQNLNICVIGDEIHIFYCVPQGEDKTKYKINQYYDNGIDWTNQEINSISRGEVLNPIQTIVTGEKIFLVYFNLVSGIEQIFIKTYDLDKQNWSDDQQLTTSKENKLYLDVIIREMGKLEIAYCEYEEGNLVVKYEKHKIEGCSIIKKIEEQKISNGENCQNPTLIYYGKMLWICWVEYNYIASRYSKNEGGSWSDIYLWKQSKVDDIVRHKYIVNKDNGDVLNYSFGSADDLRFIGFGNLENTSVIPIKRKGFVNNMDVKKEIIKNDDFIDNNYESKELLSDDNIIKKQINENKLSEEIENRIDKIENEIETLKKGYKRVLDLEEKQYVELEERILIIENFLTQNTRGFRHIRKNNN